MGTYVMRVPSKVSGETVIQRDFLTDRDKIIFLCLAIFFLVLLAAAYSPANAPHPTTRTGPNIQLGSPESGSAGGQP